MIPIRVSEATVRSQTTYSTDHLAKSTVEDDDFFDDGLLYNMHQTHVPTMEGGSMDDPKKNVNEIPSILPVIPTMDVVIFPHMVVPLLVLDEHIIAGIEEALEGSKKVMLLATKQPVGGYQGPIGVQDLYKVGTVANIMRTMRLPEGGVKILVQGLVRANVDRILADHDVLSVQLTPLEFKNNISNAEQAELDMALKRIFNLVDSMVAAGRIFGPDSQVILSQIKDHPEKIVDFLLSHLNLDVQQAQNLLEKNTIIELLEGVHSELTRQREISKVQEDVRRDTQEAVESSQREYYLREQLNAIRRQLGEEKDTEFEEFKRKFETLPLPQEVQTEVTRQFKRLEKIPPDSMENMVIRNHLDWIMALPWGKYTDDMLDIAHAKKVLDQDHFGLKEIKERILDYLSVRTLKTNCQAPILCFAGPPGVGKTSLGQSIAKALGRKFYRISLGGVHDEAEIRGHRRTYVGSMPGRFIQAIRKAESSNPVLMVDEIDKVGKDQRGDPSAALLEVLDPEQNNTFHDNYLGVPYDLSKVLFVATANDLSTIPEALRDRMEIIELSGYTNDEKIEIAKRHLVRKSITNFGLDEKNLTISEEVISTIVNKYTREAGVRQLERYIQKLCSKYARSLVEDNKPIEFTPENISDYLGAQRAQSHNTLHIHRVGVSNGLAWTPYGGEILQVEAVLVPGTGKLLLTGQLGEVMKESAQAAVTYARAHGDHFKIEKDLFDKYDLHIHVPAGAIPKDGPSAGITLLSAVISALTRRPVNSQYAMTGELTLQGEILPIGGLKEKILAAKQEGLTHVLVPKLNEHDLKRLGELGKEMNIILVENAQEVLDRVLMES